MVRYMDRVLYVDGFADVAWVYIKYGAFWMDLPVALTAPVQLLAKLLAQIGAIGGSQLVVMQVNGFTTAFKGSGFQLAWHCLG